jgi:hypothetical protein
MWFAVFVILVVSGVVALAYSLAGDGQCRSGTTVRLQFVPWTIPT